MVLLYAGFSFLDYMSTYNNGEEENNTIDPTPSLPSWQSAYYPINCPDGSKRTIPIEYRTSSCLSAKKNFAYATICNLSSALIQAQNQCAVE